MLRKLCFLLLVGGLLAVGASTALAYTRRQIWDLQRINRLRSAHRVGSALRLGTQMTRRAQYWADRLASRDIGSAGLADDTSGASACWHAGGRYYGANSAIARGYANDLSRDQHNLTHSRPHLANMLDRRFRWVGIGIATDRHGVILIQDFCGR
jgi:uncharacterized protein YkwD